MTDPKNKKRSIQLILFVFVLINSLVFLFRDFLEKNAIDHTVVLVGNVLLFLIALFTMLQSLKSINNTNPQVFVRSVLTGFIIRLFLCAIAAFVYIYMNDGKVNKPALFICMGIYAIYAAIEVNSLRKGLKEKKNA